MDLPLSTSIRTDPRTQEPRETRRGPAVRASGTDGAHSAGGASSDRVEISLPANLTAETVNGILNDSVVEQINKAIQEAGIDLRIEVEGSGIDGSPKAAARRIVDHATGFRDGFAASRPDETPVARIQGFMTLIRGAIQEGFTHAREFLEGITKLSDTIDQNISKTQELTNSLLDEFHRAQLAAMDAAESSATTREDV